MWKTNLVVWKTNLVSGCSEGLRGFVRRTLFALWVVAFWLWNWRMPMAFRFAWCQLISIAQLLLGGSTESL